MPAGDTPRRRRVPTTAIDIGRLDAEPFERGRTARGLRRHRQRHRQGVRLFAGGAARRSRPAPGRPAPAAVPAAGLPEPGPGFGVAEELGDVDRQGVEEPVVLLRLPVEQVPGTPVAAQPAGPHPHCDPPAQTPVLVGPRYPVPRVPRSARERQKLPRSLPVVTPGRVQGSRGWPGRARCRDRAPAPASSSRGACSGPVRLKAILPILK